MQLFRIFKFGILNFWRNWILSSASIIVLAIALLIISTFVVFNYLLQKTIQGINQKVDVVIYFKDTVEENDILSLKENISLWQEVRNVEYISKDKALEKWLAQTDNERLKQIVSTEENPLPRSLEVKLTSAEYVSKVVDFFNRDENRDKLTKIRYNRLVIEKIISYSNAVRKVGLVLSLIFTLIAVYAVLNTLRLAAYSRRDEIEIMHLVGASPSYIVMPFVVEAVLFGILGALVAFLLTLLGTHYALAILLPKEIMTEISSFLSNTSFGTVRILILQLVLGVVIGVICSLIGVKRYLK